MATDHLTCARCDFKMEISEEASAEARAEFKQRFGREREPSDLVVCTTCYGEVLHELALLGMFGGVEKGTMH